MKKLSLLLVILLLTAACACSSGGYRDGVYTAAGDEYVDGWRDEVTVTVAGGKITDVNWNAYNEEGQDKKTLSRDGEYDMVAYGGAKSQWHEQAASMETALVNEQDPAKLRLRSDGKTDTVSGVSITVDSFVLLAAEALQGAK